MSDLDLTEAVEAAAEWQFGIDYAHLGYAGIDAAHLEQAWEDAAPAVKHAYRESVRGTVAAAAPVIEAQVRAQIAAEIYGDTGLFAEIEGLCMAHKNPSTAADKVQDAVAASIARSAS